MCRDDDPDRDDCMVVALDRRGRLLGLPAVPGRARRGRPADAAACRVRPALRRALEFTFKVDCPTDLDCAPAGDVPARRRAEPEIDYLAKDYASFRQLLLDRLALVDAGLAERHVPDLGVTLVELLAYVGDQLSYHQDAVATEAYLDTARQRDLGAPARPARRLPDARGLQRPRLGLRRDRRRRRRCPRDVAFVTGPQPTRRRRSRADAAELGGVPRGRYEVFEPVDRAARAICARAQRRSASTPGATASAACRAAPPGDAARRGRRRRRDAADARRPDRDDDGGHGARRTREGAAASTAPDPSRSRGRCTCVPGDVLSSRRSSGRVDRRAPPTPTDTATPSG